jgi:hypothetical protein
MTTPTPKAGGFLLVAPIVIGFVVGSARGDAMAGCIIGLGIGLALLAGQWIVDRRRTGR